MVLDRMAECLHAQIMYRQSISDSELLFNMLKLFGHTMILFVGDNLGLK